MLPRRRSIFEDLERLLETHERASITHRAHIDLRAGQERHGAAKINSEAAFDTTKDRTFDAGVVCIGLFKAIPCFFTARHLAGDDRFAARVFCGPQEHLDFVANRNVWRFAGVCKFFKINAAFHLVADVDDGLARFNCDDLAFDNSPFVGCVHFEAFIQKRFEFFHRCVLSHVASVFLYVSFFWPRGCLRRSGVMSALLANEVGQGIRKTKRAGGCRPLLDLCPVALFAF